MHAGADTDEHTGMHAGMGTGMHTGMHTGMRTEMCIDMCSAMFIDMYVTPSFFSFFFYNLGACPRAAGTRMTGLYARVRAITIWAMTMQAITI